MEDIKNIINIEEPTEPEIPEIPEEPEEPTNPLFTCKELAENIKALYNSLGQSSLAKEKIDDMEKTYSNPNANNTLQLINMYIDMYNKMGCGYIEPIRGKSGIYTAKRKGFNG